MSVIASGVARERSNGPAALEQASGYCAALPAGRAAEGDDAANLLANLGIVRRLAAPGKTSGAEEMQRVR